MKVAINSCFGGFGLSDLAIAKILERKGIRYWRVTDEKYASLMGDTFLLCPPEEYEKLQAEADKAPPGVDRYKAVNEVYFTYHDLDRWDPDMIAVIEELGKEANGRFADITIVDIPFTDGKGWYIDEYDGVESIHEEHRSWT